MLLKTALIFCREPKTDDQLKAIMMNQPWDGLVHGFHNVTSDHDAYDRQYEIGRGDIDSIYVEDGATYSSYNTDWADHEMHDPSPVFLSLPDGPDDPAWKAIEDARGGWWRATLRYIGMNIPNDYHRHRIYYGIIGDEDDHELDGAWRDLILNLFGYHPNIIAQFSQPVA